ncbi:hypothetical protein BH09PSE5_BH09PSE5_49250 [soil metagenome]
MDALKHLAMLLDQGNRAATQPLQTGAQLDSVLATLRSQVAQGGTVAIAVDVQMQALLRFWSSRRLPTMRDARLVCFGLAVTVAGQGECILGDSARLIALLQAVDVWRDEPRRFRRLCQGLIRSYFSYDGKSPDKAPAARENWERLRVYLAERLPRIATVGAPNPDWVTAALANAPLFGNAPAAPYAASALQGDSRAVDRLAALLGIAPSSWFMRELMLAQLQAAARLPDAGFVQVLARLLDMLGKNPALRDQGVAMLLDRHVGIDTGGQAPKLHTGLYNAALLCWGCPWRAVDQARWGRVGPAARNMVSDWLKPDLIDEFFARWFTNPAGDDGKAALRRGAFWKRYVLALDDLRIALPEAVIGSLGKGAASPALLRRKLEGSLVTLRDADPSAAALLMSFGNAVVIEFGRDGFGVYGYADRGALPFNASPDAAHPLTAADPAPNTLRHPSRSLHLLHRDGQQGWSTWEQMFEALLKRQYGIEPGVRRALQASRHVDLALPVAVDRIADIDLHLQGERDEFRDDAPQPGLSAHWQTAEAGAVEFGRAELAIFSRVHSLRVDDDTRAGGKLWVRTGATDEGVSWVLSRWGFVYSDDEGWSREGGFR